MSGIVIQADLCETWAGAVKPGWRGGWPCTGKVTMMSGPPARPIGLVECACPCHDGGPAHELPRLSDRTALHPTDVLAGENPDHRKFWGGGG